MARLVADKHTEAVVRQANTRRLKVWQAEVERTETPLLAWAGVAEPVPSPPELETVDDRLALRRRVQEGTAGRTLRVAEHDAQWLAGARWYQYLCTLHPDAPEGLTEYFERSGRHGGPLMAFLVARRTYAKLLSGQPVQEDFVVRPAPWFDICRKHYLLAAGIPPDERKTGAWKAAMAAEVDAWKAKHADEADAWERRREDRQRRQTDQQVKPNDVRFAA